VLSGIYLGLAILCFLGAVMTHSWEHLTAGALTGAANAVELGITLAGSMGLWCGLSEVFREGGLQRRLKKRLSPLLCFLIRPKNPNDEVMAALSENFSSNLLGLGNAATPCGLRAGELLRQNGDEAAFLRLTLLNALSVQLVPTTAAALRASFGASEPFVILPRVIIGSVLALVTAFTVFRCLE